MNTIHIEQLKIKTTLGVYAWEQAIQRTIFVDIEFPIDSQVASRQDEIKDTIDYAQLTQHLQAFVASKSFQLLETLAEQSADLLIQSFNLPWVKLKISKPFAPPQASKVSITLVRHRLPADE